MSKNEDHGYKLPWFAERSYILNKAEIYMMVCSDLATRWGIKETISMMFDAPENTSRTYYETTLAHFKSKLPAEVAELLLQFYFALQYLEKLLHYEDNEWAKVDTTMVTSILSMALAQGEALDQILES